MKLTITLTYTKNHFLVVWNPDLTKCPLFYLAALHVESSVEKTQSAPVNSPSELPTYANINPHACEWAFLDVPDERCLQTAASGNRHQTEQKNTQSTHRILRNNTWLLFCLLLSRNGYSKHCDLGECYFFFSCSLLSLDNIEIILSLKAW